MKEIDIREIGNICIGQTENAEGGTGCTVFICKEGMPAGLDVRGGGPASRESELLHPLANADRIHAVLLSGGSAYGLDAAGGVMKYLEEQGLGLNLGVTTVPLVCQSDIFDLTVADPFVRPDKEMGYEAARLALAGGNYRDGNYGAGCGATVGKMNGRQGVMKAGIGSYAVQVGELKVGAVMVANSLGDIFDWKTGEKVAGALKEDGSGFADTEELILKRFEMLDRRYTGNTTIGIVMTNASFEKATLCKIAGMAHDGMARAVRPVHTSGDGDSIYAVSLGDIKADKDTVGSLAAMVVSEAILRAVRAAAPAYGLKAVSDLMPEEKKE